MDNPATSSPIFVEENASGQAPELKLIRTLYGRLVDVYARTGPNADSPTVRIATQVVVRASLTGTSGDFELRTDRITGQENLTINKDINDPVARQAANELLRGATQGLDAVFDGGYGQAGFYSTVPRNAALVLIFNDLLDPDTISNRTVETFTGPEPFDPFDARVFGDPLYGDLVDADGNGTVEFRTNRITVDFTTSSFESFQSTPALPLNPDGMPPAVDQNIDNFHVRIPTQTASNQPLLLLNLTGHAMRVFANGSSDPSAATQDIIRAFRSGGDTAITGDEFNGFLRDEDPPNLVAALPGNLTVAPQQDDEVNDPDLFTLPVVKFSSPDCAQRPLDGDFIFQTQLQGVLYARVVGDGLAPNGVGEVMNLKVRVVTYPVIWDALDGVAEWIDEGAAPFQFLSEYIPMEDAGREHCFLETFPQAQGYPGDPSQGVPQTASWGLRFNEAMALSSFSAYDGMRLSSVDPRMENIDPNDFAITEISSSPDRTRFAVTPSFPLAYSSVGTNQYYLSIVNDGDFAPTDLAGNPLLYDFDPIVGSLSTFSADTRNGVNVSLFATGDEQEPIADFGGVPGDPFPFAEWAGQHIFLQQRGVIAPRPVSRFTQVVDRNNQLVTAMTQLAGGVLEPLMRFGTRTQFLWRIYDFDIPLFSEDLTQQGNATADWRLDNSTLNIDVERVYWSPTEAGITFDRFNEFSMRMSHSAFQPDEVHSIPQDAVAYPNSGLVLNFSQNQLSPVNDTPKETHFREQGYTLDPGNLINLNNTILMPFPMNMDPDVAPRYYTWRDTSIIERAAPNAQGANIHQWSQINGVQATTGFPFEVGMCDAMAFSNFYVAGQVQTSALPLLLEFRCYPDFNAGTTNKLDVSISQATSQAPPYHRAFSSGGVNLDLEDEVVDPDDTLNASGGFNPASTPIPGAPTPGFDKNVYMGGIDFVVRVSRSYSIWFPTPDIGGTQIDAPQFFDPVVEPNAADQPPGTSIEFAFRGLGAIAGAWTPGSPVGDGTDPGFQMSAVAQLLDPYGDHYTNATICAAGPDMPEPNYPFQFVEHNSVDANLPAAGFSNGGAWSDQASEINGAQFYQVRVSFISNASSGTSPVLSTFAMGWKD